MDYKDLECVNTDELEDFELKPAQYQTRLIAIDENGEIVGIQICAEHSDPEYAVEFAKKKVTEYLKLFKENVYFWEGQEVFGAFVKVETVVETEDGSEDAGAIFKEAVFCKEEEA